MNCACAFLFSIGLILGALPSRAMGCVMLVVPQSIDTSCASHTNSGRAPWIVAGGGGANAAAVNIASMAGGNAAQNNYLTSHKLLDEEGELRVLKKQQSQGSCDGACEDRIRELETLDQQRDAELAPLIDACQKAGRNNCKGKAIAQHFAQANAMGSEAIQHESNAGTKGSPFSFNKCPPSDRGGCSYGPLQIAANTGAMVMFLNDLKANPSREAQYFYLELQSAGGADAAIRGDTKFVDTWMQLTAQDPQFVQYQLDLLIDRNLYPVVEDLQKKDVDFQSLTQAQKEALFSAAVQHGSGTDAKRGGADNIMERTFAQADSGVEPPENVPPLPTYTREDLIYGEVENNMVKAESNIAELVKQRERLVVKQKQLVEKQKQLVVKREQLVEKQLQLERHKSRLLEQGLKSDHADVKGIQGKVKQLDRQIEKINGETQKLSANADTFSADAHTLSTRVEELNGQVGHQEQYVRDAAQYLKAQAKESLGDPEKFLRDFYEQRTQMYPAQADRYKRELESLLRQYREEKKAEGIRP